MKFTKLIITATLLSFAVGASAQYLEPDARKGETTSAQPAREIKVEPTQTVACTMDAKMCPDGSYVGRVAPNCEFAPCPSAEGTVKQNPLYSGPKGENPLFEAKSDLRQAQGRDDTAQPGIGASSGGINVVPKDIKGDGKDDFTNAGEGRSNDADTSTSSPSISDFAVHFDDDRKESAAGSFIEVEGVPGNSPEGEEVPRGKDIRKNITVRLKAEELRNASEEERQKIRVSAPKEPKDVRDGEGLTLFLLSEAENTPSVRAVALSDEKLEIELRGTGKLFGLFPIEFPSTIVISTKSESGVSPVSVDLPWYSFLVNEDIDEDELKETIATEKEKMQKPSNLTRGEAYGPGTIQASVFRAVTNLLKTKHDTVKNSISNVR